uniref:CRAL-TRIO domain-containing protein n=1 Tax=Heliothis virescens TaxID=7102 RepID=A0A2A4J4G2_HELVI
MESVRKDTLLKFNPDSLEEVRKELNLEKPGRIDEAIDILDSWVQKQPHFMKKDFSRDYLERILITAKGLAERAKERLDKLCTFKTLMPEFFSVSEDMKKEMEPLQELIVHGLNMESVRKDTLLKFNPDSLEEVRKELNLEKPGRIDEAIDILDSWVQKQPHFMKKDFSRDYLERILITAKGLAERAKERLDKLCTFKTLMPEFFSVSEDMKKEMEPLQELINAGHLPQMTPEHYRVFICKMTSENLEAASFFKFYRYMTMLCEYFLQAEYCKGFQIILDYSQINILSFVTKVNPMELRQIITLMTEGYGCRIKGVHVISSSKMVDTLITLLKQVFSAKLGDRIHLHKTPETVSEYVPKEMMPSDYGGKEMSLLELNKLWLKEISSKEFLAYMNEMNKANTNESCRQSDKFNEHYIGMPGSFRALSVD